MEVKESISEKLDFILHNVKSLSLFEISKRV